MSDVSPKSFWSRRGTFGKSMIIVIGCLIVLTALASALPDPETTTADPERGAAQASATPDAGESPATEDTSTAQTTPSETPDPEPTPAQPSPKTVTGVGQQVKTVRLRESGPLIVKGTHRGDSNFIVDLVPRGGGEFDSHGLYNEIGNYTGQTVVAEAGKGRYRVKVLLGTEGLFNEIGNFKGETLIEQLASGDYLLHVQADGAWTFKFRE
jgi:hypothetical protein